MPDNTPTIEGALRSLLIGSMLGDGRLSRTTCSARFMENHADSQFDYLEWKRVQWGAWVKSEAKPVVWRSARNESHGWRFETRSHADLLPWHRLFYEASGPKLLRPEIVPLVDERAFAIWFMDDGTAGWWLQIIFGLSPESRSVAWDIFDKFGFHPRWQVRRGNTGEFHFDGEEQALAFIELIRPHVPECMQHKLRFGFQGRGFQIRQAASEEKLLELAHQEMPIRQMARELGLSASVISRRLKKLEIFHPRNVGRPKMV